MTTRGRADATKGIGAALAEDGDGNEMGGSKTLDGVDLSPDTVLRLTPGLRTRWIAAGHVLVDSPVGTIIDIGPGGFASCRCSRGR